MTRRTLLVAACGVLAVGATAMPAAADSNVRTLADGRLAVRVNRIPELARVGGAVYVGTVKGTPVGVVRAVRAIGQCPSVARTRASPSGVTSPVGCALPTDLNSRRQERLNLAPQRQDWPVLRRH